MISTIALPLVSTRFPTDPVSLLVSTVYLAISITPVFGVPSRVNFDPEISKVPSYYQTGF
tara:strand:- start:159 stop:338 length:180 start_codon:yes stop_codon:yes gene_type:complete